jgi:hypothetical protein
MLAAVSWSVLLAADTRTAPAPARPAATRPARPAITDAQMEAAIRAKFAKSTSALTSSGFMCKAGCHH